MALYSLDFIKMSNAGVVTMGHGIPGILDRGRIENYSVNASFSHLVFVMAVCCNFFIHMSIAALVIVGKGMLDFVKSDIRPTH